MITKRPVTRPMSANYKHNWVNLLPRRMRMQRKERDTDLDTPFSPSINLP